MYETFFNILFNYYCIADAHGGVIGWGFCKYDITTADMDNIKLLRMCLVPSLLLEFAKLIHEQ